jgi:hypothetical protein
VQTAWLKVGHEHINLNACTSIDEIAGGYKLYHGDRWTEIRGIPGDPDGLARVDFVRGYLKHHCLDGSRV